MIDRRGLLAGAAFTALAPLAAPVLAQTSGQQASGAKPSREDRIGAAASSARRPITFSGGRFSGPGYDWLASKGRAARFFMLGEEHGIAENPKLAAQLFADLVPSGYTNVAIEISAPMGFELDRALAGGGGLQRLFADPGSSVAFYTMREEAEWLAAARAALPGRRPFLWGTDYEVGADRHLIRLLKAKRKPPAAEAALARLEQASTATWTRFATSKSPADWFSFGGEPALVTAVRAAWPRPDVASLWILDTLEETLSINRLWTSNQPWESNRRRGAFMRANFLRHWRHAKREGRTPGVFMKYGASHLVRGRNTTETFDLGALVPEIATIEGVETFSLLVLPGIGSSIAAFNPSALSYSPTPYEGVYQQGLKPILDQALPNGMTVFDMHPLRPLLGYSRTPADQELLRIVHGFDAVLLMTGSTASTQL